MNYKIMSNMKNLKSIIALLVLTVFSVNVWGSYKLVEVDQSDWRGDYLIAYSNTIFMDGSLAGGTGGVGMQSTAVSPGSALSDKTIADAWGDLHYVTIEAIDDNNLSSGYVIKSHSITTPYFYQTSNKNGMAATDNKNTAANYPITIIFNTSSDIDISLGGNASGAILHWNNATIASGGQMFRYYKDGSQGPIYLYKKEADCTAPATSLSISATPSSIALNKTAEISTNGGNGGAITYKVTTTSGSGTGKVEDGVFSATATGTYKVSAHQDLTAGGVCEQDADVTITVGPIQFGDYVIECCTKWDAPTVTYTSPLNAGGAGVAPSITGTTHGTASYESSNTAVLTVDADGTIHPQGAGTAYIIVTWGESTEGDVDYCENQAVSNTITVNGNISVAFDAKGGEGTMENQSMPSGTSTQLNACDYTKTGYTFQGWDTDPAGETVVYADKEEVTLSAGCTLYAVWEINTYTVTFTPSIDGQGSITVNSNSTGSVSVNYGETVTIIVTENTHYTLATLTANSNDIKDTKSFTMPDEAVEIAYSFAEAANKMITFYNNGEQVVERKAYIGEAIGVLPEQGTMTSCDETSTSFVGWTAEDISEKATTQPAMLTASTVITAESATAYNALWAEGGEAEMPIEIAYWAKQAMTANTPITATSGAQSGATLIPEVNLTSQETYTYSNSNISSTPNPSFVISNIDLTSYADKDIAISFVGRNSQQSSFTVSTSTDGDNYTTIGTTADNTKLETPYTIYGIPSTAKYIKLTGNITTGNLYLGTIKLKALSKDPYQFEALTAENTDGWTGEDWNGAYLIAYDNGENIDVLSGYAPAEKSIFTLEKDGSFLSSNDLDNAFEINYSSANSGYSVQGKGIGKYLSSDYGTSGALYVSDNIAYHQSIEYNLINANGTSKLYHNSTSFKFYSSTFDFITLYKLLPTSTKYITSCEAPVVWEVKYQDPADSEWKIATMNNGVAEITLPKTSKSPFKIRKTTDNGANYTYYGAINAVNTYDTSNEDWTCDTPGNDVKLQTGAAGTYIITATELTTDHPHFTVTYPTAYTITFDGNGADGSMAAMTNLAMGEEIYLTANGFTKTCNDFVEWNTNQDGTGGTAYIDEGSVTVSGNMTLYAQWTPKRYDAIYDANGVTGYTGELPATVTYNCGDQVTIDQSKTLSKFGYTFIGWNTDRAATTPQPAEYNPFTIDQGDTRIYAIWAATKPTGIAIAPASGGNSPVKGTGVQMNVTLTPDASTMAEENREVTWSSSNTTYATVNQSGYVNFVGQGTVTITATSKVDGSIVDNYTFNVQVGSCDGWIISAYDNGGDNVTNDYFRQVGSSDEWRVKYVLPNGTRKFWVGGSSCAWSDHSDNWEFGWIRFKDRRDNKCENNTQYPGQDAVGELVIWSNSTDNNYGIAFLPNYKISYMTDGSNWRIMDFHSTSTQYSYETDIFQVPAGYKSNNDMEYFVGIEKNDGSNMFVDDGISSTDPMNGVNGLKEADMAGKYGKWHIWSNSCANNWYCEFNRYYQVQFEMNGGDGNIDPMYFYANNTESFNTNTLTNPTKTGYELTGWKDQEDHTYTTSQSITVMKDLVLTAQWTARNYTITFDKNEGNADGGATATYDNGTLTSVTHVSRTGYDLNGYYTAASDGKMIVTAAGTLVANQSDYTDASGNWKKAENCTLHAQWTAKQYTVTLDNQEATTAGATEVTATYDADMPSIAGNLPAKTGYDFGGYYDGIDGAGTQYYNNTGASAHAWDKTAGATLYAKWTYTVTLNDNDAEEIHVVNEGESYTLPELSCATGDFTRVGWTKTAPTGNRWASKPTLAGATVSEGGTYYAVYGEGSGDQNTFVRVNSITDGAYVITSTEESPTIYAMKYTGDNDLGAQVITESSTGVVNASDPMLIWNVTVSGSAISLQTQNTGNKYIGINNEKTAFSRTDHLSRPWTVDWYDGKASLNAGNDGDADVYLNYSKTKFGLDYDYDYKLVFYKQEGAGLDYISNPVCCVDKVAAPVVNDATKTHNSITLSWSNVTGATGYKVTINGATHDVTTSSPSYTESGLTPNTAYSWTVVATWDPEGAYCGAIAANGTTTTNPVYTVMYVKAGGETGSAPTDANTYPQGGSVTVAGRNTLTYSGYDFAGWECSQDGETYTEGQAVTMGGGDITFTAVWTPKKDTYFDDIHKTIGYTGDGHIEEGQYTVPTLEDDSGGSNSCETGHSVFVGWVAESSTNPDGTLKPGFTITYGGTENKAAKNIRYHAVWAESGK